MKLNELYKDLKQLDRIECFVEINNFRQASVFYYITIMITVLGGMILGSIMLLDGDKILGLLFTCTPVFYWLAVHFLVIRPMFVKDKEDIFLKYFKVEVKKK